MDEEGRIRKEAIVIYFNLLFISSLGIAEGNNEHLSQLGRHKDVFMAGYIANETGLLTTEATAANLL